MFQQHSSALSKKTAWKKDTNKKSKKKLARPITNQIGKRIDR